jgi:hypothetical protein
MECEYCKTILKSKYNLKSHLLKNKTCLKLRGLDMISNFLCKGCQLSFTSNFNLTIHHDSCKYYQCLLIREECDKTIKDLNDKYNKEIEYRDKIIKDLNTQNEKFLLTIEKLASQAIDKTQANITTNNHTNIRNIYSDQYFLENISEDFVKRKCQNYLTEQVFMEGQRGIAQLCSEHIINTPDKKVLLKCSDTSRKKFKYIDEKGNIKEDHEARVFTEKVFEPIKKVSQDVYETILTDIEGEQETVEEDDYSKKSQLRDKTMRAIDCFAQIINIDNPNQNSEFKTELAILNK